MADIYKKAIVFWESNMNALILKGKLTMKITSSQMKKILTTKNNFSQLGFNLLITRLARMYNANPSDDVLQQCTDETNAFLEKYQAIMKQDFEKISSL